MAKDYQPDFRNGILVVHSILKKKLKKRSFFYLFRRLNEKSDFEQSFFAWQGTLSSAGWTTFQRSGLELRSSIFWWWSKFLKSRFLETFSDFEEQRMFCFSEQKKFWQGCRKRKPKSMCSKEHFDEFLCFFQKVILFLFIFQNVSKRI